jgi:CPA1 family monovalent cation:H+ antiporter
VVETTVQQVAWFLVASALIGMITRRLRMPYVIALVILGLVVASTHVVAVPQLEPRVFVFAFLPPLLFDAAFRLDARELRALARPIVLFAGPGVVLTAVTIAVVGAVLLKLPPVAGLVLGSLVAATDPVAVTAVFRQLRVPKRTAVIVEGESLINDGVAVTFYTVVLGFSLTGRADPGAIVGILLWQLVGGVLMGGVIGFLGSRLTRAIDDHLVEMTLSTALAYGSYLLAQSAGSSGPLACVAAGVIHGSYGRRIGMSERTQERLDDLWEYLGFLANSFVFLLMGFTIDIVGLIKEIGPILIAVVAALMARTAMTVAVALLQPRDHVGITRGEQLVLIWGGLRGGLTIALTLALPEETPARGLITTLAFGIALFTLVIQGLTLPVLIRRVGLGRAT